MAVPSLTKAELRIEGLRRRREYARGLSDETRRALEAALAARILPHLVAAGVVAVYQPLRDEISPLPILDSLADGQRGVLPWFADRDSNMIWREAPAVEAGPWNLLQPDSGAAALSPDVVIVPLVLVDREGTRIGHGQGHYDRALAHLRSARPVVAIGVGWDEQLVDDAIPADPWDMKLDAVATPGEWISCR